MLMRVLILPLIRLRMRMRIRIRILIIILELILLTGASVPITKPERLVWSGCAAQCAVLNT